MAIYQYRALQANGAVAEGQLDAAGRPDALRQIETLGLRPVQLSEKAATGRIPAAAKALWSTGP
ncbi:MAG: hypothetical protein KGR98_02905, partial [Verrucomicrobia bacterium]|nr:hypothetical protein [Verrucomicrobiota bacterium]